MTDAITWIEQDEKFALMALALETEAHIALEEVGPSLHVVGSLKYGLPLHWKEWIGSVRAEQVEESSLLLVSKRRSANPGVLDGENNELKRRIDRFYLGLLLTRYFAPDYKPILITGARTEDELSVRQVQDVEKPIRCFVRLDPPISRSDLTTAANLASCIDQLDRSSGRFWRLSRAFQIFTHGRVMDNVLDRLHQFCRCIDGLILPSSGETKKQFKSRTELFIGPHFHELMGEIYDVRSALEHLNEDRYVAQYNRDVRIDILKKAAIVEHMARTSIARIVADPKLSAYFENSQTLSAFWSLGAAERKVLWGDAIDPMSVLSGFDPSHIQDYELGGP